MKQFITIISALIIGIAWSGPPLIQDLVIPRYPLKVGNTWEYHRTFYTIVYDTVNHDTMEYLFNDSLFERVDGYNNMKGHSCSRLSHILFEEGDTFEETWWFAHPDTALLWIAYINNHKQKPIARSAETIRFKTGDHVCNSPRELASYLNTRRYSMLSSPPVDTIYWTIPKKLFIFPLQIDKSWVAMTDPWYEIRDILAEEKVSVPAGDFFTLKTKLNATWMEDTDIWRIWLGPQGIIKDSMHVVSEAYDNVGNTIGYCVSDDIYELTNLNVSIGIKNQTVHTPLYGYFVQTAGDPAGSRIVFRYTLTSPAHVDLAIYDSKGRLIKRLVSERQSSGIYTILWDNRDSAGHKTSSHLYLGCLKTDNALTVNKLVVLQ